MSNTHHTYPGRLKKIRQLKVEVESSLVEFVEYNYLKAQMLVRFKRGKAKKRQQVFKLVTPQDFWIIINSDSIGRTILQMQEIDQASWALQSRIES